MPGDVERPGVGQAGSLREGHAHRTKIAIIGGGIGGLTAVVALSRKGLAAEVYEQAPVLEEVETGWAYGRTR